MALSNVADVTWVSLQKGEPQAQIGDYLGRAPLVNFGAEINDYQDTMAIIASLDLVVTVDTSVAQSLINCLDTNEGQPDIQSAIDWVDQ